jgi:hypothetical protein
VRIFRQQIALGTGPAYAEKAADWVTDKGRMKFARTTYRSLNAVDAELAKKTFLAHAGFYRACLILLFSPSTPRRLLISKPVAPSRPHRPPHDRQGSQPRALRGAPGLMALSVAYLAAFRK